MRAAIYSRVSMEEQNPEHQRLALRRYCKNAGWKIVMEREEKISTRKDTRPGRLEIEKAARRREIDTVVVWKLDRWGRSIRDLIMSFDELRQLGIGFVSLTEALDFTTSAGRALIGMLMVFAEFERDLIRERTLAGLAHARSRGVKLGPKFTARDHFNTWKAKELHTEGIKQVEIAKRLGISKSSVCRILKGVEA